MAEFQQYLAILDSDPTNPQALAALESSVATDGAQINTEESFREFDRLRKSLRERGELDLVTRLLDLELGAVTDAERQADLLLEKGDLYVNDLLEHEPAVACFQQVLELRPDDSTAAETLAHMDMEQDNWPKFVQKNLDEARVSTDRGLTTHMYLSAAKYYARFAPESEEVETCLRKALDADPRNTKAAILLERRLRQAERWDDLMALLEERSELAGTKEERLRALLGLVELAGEDAPDRVVASMEKVVELEPAHPQALSVLADAYERQENWQALVNLYTGALKARRRGGMREPELGPLLQIAMLHWRRLDDLDAAEEYFRRIRKVEPAHPAALDFYRAYYPARGEVSKLLQVLRQAQKSLPTTDEGKAQRRALSVEIAEVAEDQLGNPEKAIDAWKSILRAEPRAQDAREALKRLYRKTEKWNALLDMMKDEIERLPKDDIEGRVSGLMEVVAIYRDRLKLDVMVINTYNAILKLDPQNRQALDDLAAKYKELGRWNDLISVLSRKADIEDLPVDDRADILREIAALWSERFGNYAQAVKPLEQLVALCPDDAAAAARLKEIYTRRRQWRSLVRLLDSEAENLAGEARRDKLVEVARLAADRLGDQRLAIEYWNRVLEPEGDAGGDDDGDDAPGAVADPEALAALAHLYERDKRYSALAEIYRRQRALAEDDAAAVAALEKLGSLFADRLGAPALAAEAFQEILDIQPDHARALRTLRELYAAAGDYQRLEKLYADLGQWDELVEAFHAIADRLDDRDAKLALLERTAEIAAQNFDKPDKIARAYERVLSVDPKHLGAARALVPVYAQAQKWARLLSTYEILLEHAEDDATRLDLHLKICELCETRLGSKAMAFQWCARAFEMAPRHPELLQDLERLGGDTDEWEQVAEILDRRAHSDGVGDDEKLVLLRELGTIAAVRLHEPERARAYQRQVLELAPDDPDAMAALEDIATQLSEWPDLLKVYRRRVELAEDEDTQVELLFKIAFIEEERLAAFDEAARTYKAILEIAPDSQRAMRALAKLQEARGDWEGLAEVLDRELEHTGDGDAKVALLMRIGALRETSLDRAEAALDAYRDAFVISPEDERIHKALERFLDDQGSRGTSAADRVPAERRVEVAELLLPIYEAAGDAARVARAIEVVRHSADDVARREYDRRLAGLYAERLGDDKRAYEAGLRVLSADPLDGDIRARLLELSAALGRDEDLAEHLSRALDQCSDLDDPLARRALATELARLYDDSLRTPEKAEKAWAAVLELPGGDVDADADAYDALDRIYRAAGRWRDLRELLVRREQATPDGEARKHIVLAICDLEEGVLDNPEGAIEAYQRVIDLDPGYMRAYKALERLYDSAERYRDLEELIGRELDYVVDDGEHIQLTYRRAELRARHLDDLGGAVDLLEDVVTRKSRHSEARKLLEELMQRPDLRLRIARILEPIYEHDGNWRDLCAVLRAQREFAASPPEAASLLSRVASVQEDQLGDDPSALETWIETFKIDPAEEASRASVRRLASMLDRWGDAARAYEDALGVLEAGDLSLRGELLTELAQIYDRNLADTDRAIDTYRRLLDLDPGNPETSQPAARALAWLYEEDQRWRDLIEILRRQAEWADTSEDRKKLLARIASIDEEQLGDADSAVATWREVLTEDPEDAAALDALERLYAAGGKSFELIEILRRRVELTEDAGERKAHLGRIARLFEGELEDPFEAMTAYLEILDYVPDDREAMVELSRLYRDQERYPDLLDVLERRLAICTEEDEAVALTYEVGALLHGHLQREAEALERYAEVLTLRRDHPEALAALEGLVDDPELRRRAAELLEPLYEDSEDHHKRAELLLRVADGDDDVREKLRCLREVARIREHHQGDRDGALEVAVRAVKTAVTEPELPELINEVARLAADLGRAGDLIDIYRDIAPDVLDGELQRRLYLDVADLARAVRQDVDLAREHYQMVLDAQPDDPRAMAALESIFRDTGEHAELYEILIRKAELAGDDIDAQAAALAEAAALCAEALDRPEDAIVAWEQVLDLIPDNRDAVTALETLYEDSERWHDLVELLERRLGYAFTVEEAVILRYRLGEIHEDKLHDPEAAVENYSAALGGDPSHGRATEALERFLDDPGLRGVAADVLEQIYVGQQDWLKLVRIYEIKLEAADDPAERLELTRHIARLYEEQLEDLVHASRWYGRVFRENPSDAAVRDQLLRLAAILDNWAELAHVYQEYLDDEPGMTEEVAIVARLLGDIYNDRLDEIERAMVAYRRVLEVDPEDLGTFERLESMLVRGERWHALVEVYEDAIAHTADEDRRQGMYIRLARVQENHLHNPAQAIDAYRAVLDMSPDHMLVITELERLYQDQSLWFELAELFQARIERSDDADEVIDYRLRLAEVMESRLEDTLAAIEQYEIVLGSEAGWRKALPPLERLIVEEDYRERIAAMLEPIYRANDWWQKLVVILDTQVAYVEDPRHRVDMLREIARLHETRGGDESLALDALSRAWLEDVHDTEVYDELSALAAKLGAWDKLVATLEQGVEDEYDYDLVASVLTRVAEIHEAQRGDTDSAIGAWRRVLEVKDDELSALTALDRLLAGEGRFEELVEVVHKRAELADSPGTRLVMLHRIAALYEDELDRPEEAIAAYRNVLSVDDADRQALDALERLYRDQKEWHELVEILARIIELSDDPAERRALRMAAAEIHDRELADAYEAVALYNAVAEEDPTDREVLAKLDELYAREAMWPELVDVLDRRAELAVELSERAELTFRAAQVVDTELLEPDAAIERYAAVLDLVPEHEGARRVLDAMVQNEDTLERAAAVLERLYRGEGDVESLAELYERKLEVEHPDPDVRKQHYAALAEIYEELQGELDAAFAVWARALAEHPDDPDIQGQLDRLTSVRGNWEDLAALLEERLVDIVDAELEYGYASKLASLYEDALGDLDQAAAKYRQALEVAGDERTPLQALDRIYSRAGKYEDLAEILARQAEATTDEHEQGEFLFRLGDVRERALYDVAGAVAAYSEVLERAPEHTGARAALERLLLSAEGERPAIISILEPLYESEGDYARLADLLTAKLSITADHLDRSQIYSRVAELAEVYLSDPVRALDASGGWLAEDPHSEEALAQLERLAESVGRWGEVAARLQGIVESADADEVKRALLGKLGAIQLYRLGNPEAAEEAFKRQLDIDPEAATALESLASIYRDRGDRAALADTQWRLGELAFDAHEKRQYFVEAAALREELGAQDGAIDAWMEVLALDEGDREALDRLARIYEQREDWERLIDILEQSSRHAADMAEERAIKTRIAGIYDTLGRLDDAVSAWQEVLDAAPDAVDALVALEAVHARREDWVAVQETMTRRLDVLDTMGADHGTRIELLHQLARLAENQLESVDEAIGYLYQVLDIDPGHAQTYEALERVLGKAERWHDLVELLEHHAGVQATVGDARGEVRSLARAADLWEGPLDNPDAAGEILEKILHREPNYVPALTRLAKIYENAADWDRCGEILERALSLGPSGRDAAELYHRLGEVARQRDGSTEQAMQYWSQALQADGSYVPAIEAMEEVARQQESWALVADMVARREQLATDEGDKLELTLELAELYKKLGQPEQVIPLLERAAQVAPDDVRVQTPLADLYFAAGRHDEAAPIYERLAEEARKKRKMKDVAMYRQRLGGIFEARGEMDQALASYEEAFRVNPTDVATMAGLGRIYLAREAWEKARRVYRSMVLQNIDPEMGISKADVYYHLGTIHLKLDEPRKAKGMFQRGLEVEPDNEALKQALASLE